MPFLALNAHIAYYGGDGDLSVLVKTPYRHLYADKSKKFLEVDNGEMYIISFKQIHS